MTKAKQKTKKGDKEKDDAALAAERKPPNAVGETAELSSTGTTTINPQTLATTTVIESFPAATVPTKTPTKPCFQSEIQSMMYAFGDARRPSSESARLIEEIVHRQISNLVVQTAEVTSLRGGKFMHTEDIKFLMRKDKEKLKKLNLYLSFKENKQKFAKQISQDEDELLGGIAGGERTVTATKKRRHSDAGDEPALFGDDAYDQKRERLERAERLSRTLDTQQYMEFVECRQANFNKKAGKFKEWLDYSNLTDLKPNTPIMEVFSYLAYETVGQIVELSLLVKKDIERSDELSAVMPLLRENNAAKINLPFLSTSSLSTNSRSSTPTPPGTPTNGVPPTFQSSTATGSASSTLTSSSASALTAATLSKSSKSKKRKVKLCSTGSTDLYSDCIQPHHIREALRRYFSSVGPLAPFSPSVKTTVAYRTLCL